MRISWIRRLLLLLDAVTVTVLIVKEAILDEMKAKLDALIEQRNRQRGRPLTAAEQLANLTFALGECDSDCASQRQENYCDCGARKFRAKFGHGKHTL